MARIRSVHPGQWRDQDFVECSIPARLLAIAIRNEADDQGIFEWKPKQIKMNLFPADAIDVEPLLEELVRFNLMRKYEIDGRQFGAIRNFRLYQRPKTPNAIHPMSHEIRKYVGLDGRNSVTASEIDDASDDLISETLGKSPEQRKEEGGRMKEEGEGGRKKASSGAAKAAPPDTSPEFVRIPTNRFETKGEQFIVTENFIEQFQQLYPAVDVRAQVKAACAWSIANEDRRKTLGGMKRFINDWLAREQNRGGKNGGNRSIQRQPNAHENHRAGWASLLEREGGGSETVQRPQQLALEPPADGNGS